MCQPQAALTSTEHSSIAMLSILDAAGAGASLWNVEVGQQVKQNVQVFALWTLSGKVET
jgi:hypothetical protein